MAKRTLKNCSLIKKMGDAPPQYDGKCEGYEGNTDEPYKVCRECKLNVWSDNND